jgi:two-component system chemotaxis response regulator CheY
MYFSNKLEKQMSKVIMAVDDSTSIRQMVGFILKDAGFEVIEAVDGQDAVNHLLKNSGIDMIITDLNMPNMDGIELIKQARAMPKYKYIPIVMLTTESQDNKKQAGKAAGATGWIVKPFQPEQLLAVIRKVLR